MEDLRPLTTGFRDLSFKIKSRLLPGGSSHALETAMQLQGLMHHSLLRANQKVLLVNYRTGKHNRLGLGAYSAPLVGGQDQAPSLGFRV